MTDRATKEEQLAFLKNEFSDVASVILTSVQGLNAFHRQMKAVR